MYSAHKVVVVETRDPKNNYEVTGLGTVALPCQLEFMTFLGNLRPEKTHVYIHFSAWTIVMPVYVWNVGLHLYFDSTVCAHIVN